MSHAQRTWHIVPARYDNKPIGTATPADLWHIQDDNGRYIFMDDRYEPAGLWTPDELHLIAAAPEMHAVLTRGTVWELLADLLESPTFIGNWGMTSAHLSSLLEAREKAIAKAEANE